MVTEFQHSILPGALVLAFSYALPFIEFGTGLLLLLGLFTRQALIIGTLLMMALIFGSTTIQKFDPIGLQLAHAAFCIVLLIFADSYNCFALDTLSKDKLK